MELSEAAARFAVLFAGLDRAHGVFNIAKKGHEGEKLKGRALTEHTPVTPEIWRKHLAGEQGLGVVPIRDDGTVYWAALDIDQYNKFDLIALEQKLIEMKLPLVVLRSKSGGAHLILFCAEPISAKYIRGKMTEWAVLLGYPAVEIFPKQDQIRVQSDVGNWLNMPYFDAAKTSRYAIFQGEQLSVEDFLKLAEGRRVTKLALDKFIVAGESFFEDGPPCLQHLASRPEGFPRGTRNNALLNLGVFARMFAGDDWREKVEEFNRQYIRPPLSSSEVANTVKSLSKKNYFYMCNLEPIVSVCNKDICRTRKYGIGQTDVGSVVRIDRLTKINSSPPTYIVEIEGSVFECAAIDLLQQHRFKILAFEKTNRAITVVKEDAWIAMINEKMGAAEILDAPADADPEGQFRSHLEEFCTSRVTAKAIDEVLLAKPFVDPQSGRTYFRSTDLLRYLESQRFRDFTEREIWLIVKRMKGEHHQLWLKGKNTTVWSIPSFKAQDQDFAVPKVEGDDL